MNISAYRKLLRVEQWYKNFVIFLPLLFTGVANRYTFGELCLGWLGLSAVSSMSYILNDWIDREKDALHPTKKNRPLASGEVTKMGALTVELVLGAVLFLICFRLGYFYVLTIGCYAALSTLYTFSLKHIPLVDSVIIATNFLIRTMAGVKELPSVDACVYLLIIFSFVIIFLTHKRRSDIKLLGEKGESHKPVLKFYTPSVCYTIRFFCYIIFISSIIWLIAEGRLAPLVALAVIILTALVSTMFSSKPELVLKPHYLFKIWYWNEALIGLIILLLLEIL